MKWKKVHDGLSLAMIQSPSGRIFRIQELGAKGQQSVHRTNIVF